MVNFTFAQVFIKFILFKNFFFKFLVIFYISILNFLKLKKVVKILLFLKLKNCTQNRTFIKYLIFMSIIFISFVNILQFPNFFFKVVKILLFYILELAKNHVFLKNMNLVAAYLFNFFLRLRTFFLVVKILNFFFKKGFYTKFNFQ